MKKKVPTPQEWIDYGCAIIVWATALRDQPQTQDDSGSNPPPPPPPPPGNH